MKTNSQPDPLTDEALSQAMDGLWARFLPDVLARVSILESASQSARKGNLTATQREAAQSAAHKLAGVLGTFGLTRGTDLARELELALALESAQNHDVGPKLAETVRELLRMIENRKPSA